MVSYVMFLAASIDCVILIFVSCVLILGMALAFELMTDILLCLILLLHYFLI